MSLKRVTAALTVTALILGVAAAPALAKGRPNQSNQNQGRVSETYSDMGDYGWGLKDVTKLSVKGIFKGRGEGSFAPGAKITHQETAVALVRLMDREDEAQALTQAQVDAALATVADAETIADWARNAVALLSMQGVLTDDEAFSPTEDTTRLEIAIMLVKALGFEAEALEKADATLAFKDARLIPADAVGYVATAVDHQLITGYDDKTFRPQQAVKRVEMAVMMGRADGVIGDERPDTYNGVIWSVNAADDSFVIKVRSKEIPLTLAAGASIFIDGAEGNLSALVPGMRAQVQLNAVGEALFIEVRSAENPNEHQIEGTITALVPAQNLALALVAIDTTVFPIAADATITIDGLAASYDELAVGDSIKATATFGVIRTVEVEREAAEFRSGTISALVAAKGGNPARITLTYPSLTTPAPTEEFILAAGATMKVNDKAVAFADLRVGDSADLSIRNDKVTAVEVIRIAVTVEGTIVDLTPKTSKAPAAIAILENGNITEYSLAKDASFTLNGEAAVWGDLEIGDKVTLTLGSDLVDAIEASRTIVTTVEGTIMALSTTGITVSHEVEGVVIQTAYTIPLDATITLNSATAMLADIHLNDEVKLTLENEVVTMVEVTR